MRKITLDIETIGGTDMTRHEVTVVGIHDSQSDTYRAFEKNELGELWPILEGADILIGYNLDHFDIPTLNRYYTGDLTKIRTVDLLKEIRNVTGRRFKLDNVADATLGKKKSGNGLEAMTWWEKGEVEKVKLYCLDDVKITKEIYDYALAQGSLKYRDYNGVREIKLDTSAWETLAQPSLTHTLPF